MRWSPSTPAVDGWSLSTWPCESSGGHSCSGCFHQEGGYSTASGQANIYPNQKPWSKEGENRTSRSYAKGTFKGLFFVMIVCVFLKKVLSLCWVLGVSQKYPDILMGFFQINSRSQICYSTSNPKTFSCKSQYNFGIVCKYLYMHVTKFFPFSRPCLQRRAGDHLSQLQVLRMVTGLCNWYISSLPRHPNSSWEGIFGRIDDPNTCFFTSCFWISRCRFDLNDCFQLVICFKVFVCVAPRVHLLWVWVVLILLRLPVQIYMTLKHARCLW